MSQLFVLRCLAEVYLARLRALREDERGMTTETVIITAALAALALAATLVIATKVSDKAGRITTD